MIHKSLFLVILVVSFTATKIFSQSLPLPTTSIPTTTATTTTLPPIPAILKAEIDKLPNFTTYKERSATYKMIHDELQKRCIRIGFFGSASDVTSDFSNDIFSGNAAGILGFDKSTNSFLQDLSKGLAEINQKHALELLQTGKLATGNFDTFEKIDEELVKREQDFAQKMLDGKSAADKKGIIDSVNGRWRNLITSSVTNSIPMIKEVEKEKGVVYDYGNIDHRKAVGSKLAAKYRKLSSTTCK